MYVFIWKERKRPSICWVIPQMSAKARAATPTLGTRNCIRGSHMGGRNPRTAASRKVHTSRELQVELGLVPKHSDMSHEYIHYCINRLPQKKQFLLLMEMSCFYFLIHLLGRQDRGRDRERSIYSSNTHNQWNQVGPKQGVQAFWAAAQSHVTLAVASQGVCYAQVRSWSWASNRATPIWDTDVLATRLITCLLYHPIKISGYNLTVRTVKKIDTTEIPEAGRTKPNLILKWRKDWKKLS